MIRALVNNYIWNPSKCDCECDKAWKISEYLRSNYCSCKKYLFGKLVLACEDEILTATETSIVDKKVTYKKNNCFIYTILLVITSYY